MSTTPPDLTAGLRSELTETLIADSDLNVNLIDAPDFDAYRLCTFKTGNEVTLAPSITQRPEDLWPINQIAVGPPQAIVSVTCSGTISNLLCSRRLLQLDNRNVHRELLQWLLCCEQVSPVEHRERLRDNISSSVRGQITLGSIPV